MLGICFFTQLGEYTGEPLWEGKKGVVNDKKITFSVVVEEENDSGHEMDC
jgi:hypothetical protein